MKYILIIVPVLVIVFGIFLFLRGQNTMKTIKIKNQQFQVDVVNLQADIEKGLSGQENMAENEGMLFQFSDLDFRTFWMKDMFFDLDILFISDNVIREIITLQKPTGNYIPLHRSKKKVDYVLELNSGVCEKYGIKVGDAMVIGNE